MGKNKPSFSYIIATYNDGKYLESTLDSLLSQGLGRNQLEVIIGNDASKDDTQQVINKFKKYSCVKTFTNETNQGCCVTRNKAHKLATKDFTALLDGDDLLVPGSVKKLQSFIAENNADLIIPRMDKFFEDGQQEIGSTWPENLDIARLNKFKGQDFFLNCKKSGVRMWTPISSRESLVKNNVTYREEDTNYCEDDIYSLQAYLASKNQFVFNEPYYLYRRRPGSRSTAISQEMIDKRLSIGEFVRGKMIPQNPSYTKFLGEMANSYQVWADKAVALIK